MTTTQELILSLTKWTWDEYCHYQYVTGLQQIGKLLPRLTSLSTVEESTEFWEAFRKRWNRCDELFIADIPMQVCANTIMSDHQSKEVIDMYKSYHGFEAFEALPIAVQRKINEQKYQELRRS